MIYFISHTTDYTSEILSSCKEGTVHSVYRKTINLKIGSYILALQAAASPLSPISLITTLDEKSMADLSVTAGQMVNIKNSTINISAPKADIHFKYFNAPLFSSKLFPVTDFDKCLPVLQQVLNSSRSNGFRTLFWNTGPMYAPVSGLDLSLVLTSAGSRISKCTTLFNQKFYEDAAMELTHLLGLGIGLTPSGDDFLCGVLAGLILCGKSSHPFSRCLKAGLLKHLSDTNDISQAFLMCALHSHFSQAVKSLTSSGSAEDILTVFEAIGHSSGIDTLCGIFYAVSLYYV